MPFTVSHIVAALPLNKGLGKYTALSPLIIGSMTPDVAYLTPFLVHQRVDSHSLLGIYLFCIPMGLTIYFLYHLLMAPVLVSFLPKFIQKHLNPDLFIGKLPSIPSHVLVISLVLGALTHIIWDFFTHQSAGYYIPFMNVPLVNIDGYDIMPYRLLQHLSSLFGLGLLMYWIFAWTKRIKHIESNNIFWQAPKKLKVFAFAAIALFSFVISMIYGYSRLPDTDVLYGLYSLQVFIRYALVSGMGAFLVSCLAMGVLYQFAGKQETS